MVKYICGEYMKKYFIVFLLFLFLLSFIPEVKAAKTTSGSYSNMTIDISKDNSNCAKILGNNGTALIKLAIAVVRIAAVVICIIQMMLAFIPAITKDDPKGLNKAFRKSILLMVIMLCAFLLPTFIDIIGTILGFDTTCFR